MTVLTVVHCIIMSVDCICNCRTMTHPKHTHELTHSIVALMCWKESPFKKEIYETLDMVVAL